jgi:hypothetical protein
MSEPGRSLAEFNALRAETNNGMNPQQHVLARTDPVLKCGIR